jgi:serine kinase of HPr protein (carbohydrate metabolism regulator)
MKLNRIIRTCKLKSMVVRDEKIEIKGFYTSDLLSDVMAHCPEESLLITVQNHANTIAVATLVGVRAIVIVHDRAVPDDMQLLAKRENVALLTSSDDQFTLSYRIGKLADNFE